MDLVCTRKIDKQLIGQGAYGKIYKITEPSRATYVLKVATDAKEERAKHIALWNTIDESCRKYFIKPLKLPAYCVPSSKRYSLHAMQYISGVNMHDYVTHQLALGNKFVVKLVKDQLKKAIMCMWKSGFVHMDLHMRNVLVVKDGIKILDFGLSEKVTPLKSPKTKKDLVKWFTEKYEKTLKKLGFNASNPNLYAYGIKKHPMFYKPNQKLYNNLHKLSSIKY